MTDKQERFCQEYVIDLDPVRAYMAVYKNCKKRSTASTNAWKLLKNAEISARVRAMKEEIAKGSLITAEEVVRDLMEVKNRCLQAVPVKVWDEESHTYVESEAEYTFDSKGATAALKLLGEYTGMFEKKIRVSGLEAEKSKLDDLIRQMRGDEE